VLGFITSPKAARVYDFLTRAGPTPFPALAVATGLMPGDLAKALRHLRGAGRAAPVRLRGVEFWAADGVVSFDAATQEARAWFCARLREAGIEFERDEAAFPAGTYRFAALKDRVVIGERYYCLLDDLKQAPLARVVRE